MFFITKTGVLPELKLKIPNVFRTKQCFVQTNVLQCPQNIRMVGFWLLVCSQQHGH